MNEKKLSVAEFAALVGTTSKTIYERIKKNSELPLQEQLITVEEKIKGRSVTLISANLEQINFYKTIYNKSPVNNGEYYKNLTENEVQKPLINENNEVKTNDNDAKTPDLLNRLLTINEDNNNRILQLTSELITVKQSQLLLEDKANREGLYLKEINDLKTQLKNDNNRNKIIIYSLITALIILLIVIITSLTWYFTVNLTK